MKASSSRGGAVALDDALRSCLARIGEYGVFLSSEDRASREDARRQIVESIQHLSGALEQPAKQLAAAGNSGSDPAAIRSVLVLDEDPASGALVRRVLPAEVDVIEAADSGDALRLGGRAGVEVVILSWRASTFSGPEVLAELRIRYPNLRLVVVADADDEAYEGVATALGSEAFLTRPLSSRQVLAALDIS